MDTYTIQQILERCEIKICTDITKTVEGIEKTIRMIICKEIGWNKCTCEKLSKEGKVDLLRYAHENGCPWNKDTCSEASIYGHLECLKYAHENGCPWDRWTCTNTSRCGH